MAGRRAVRARVLQSGKTIFDLADADFPDDALSVKSWFWIVSVVGLRVAERAVQKAASNELLETSEDVMESAKAIVETWLRQGLVTEKERQKPL